MRLCSCSRGASVRHHCQTQLLFENWNHSVCWSKLILKSLKGHKVKHFVCLPQIDILSHWSSPRLRCLLLNPPAVRKELHVYLFFSLCRCLVSSHFHSSAGNCFVTLNDKPAVFKCQGSCLLFSKINLSFSRSGKVSKVESFRLSDVSAVWSTTKTDIKFARADPRRDIFTFILKLCLEHMLLC